MYTIHETTTKGWSIRHMIVDTKLEALFDDINEALHLIVAIN